MGKKHFSGGGTLLNDVGGFRTYDPAEAQKRTFLRAEPALQPVRASSLYSQPVQAQVIILLRKVAKGERKPYIPSVFKDEIENWPSLIDWAKSHPDYEEILKNNPSVNRGDIGRVSKASMTTKLAKRKRKKKSDRGPKAEKTSSVERDYDASHRRSTTAHEPSSTVIGAKKLGISEQELLRRVRALRAHLKVD